MTSTDTADAANDAEYERDRAEAEADGTAIPEREHDFPPADLFHAAQALFAALDEDARTEINAPDDPALWGRLDADRAAALLSGRRPDAFADLAARFPWLTGAADGSGTGAFGAMADQF